MLVNANKYRRKKKNQAGSLTVESGETLTVASGATLSVAGTFTTTGIVSPIAPVAVSGNTTLTAAAHANRTVVVNAAAGATITLPAATGTGNKYKIIVGTTLTSGSLVVAVANATDYMRGFAILANDVDGSASNFETANTGTVATESDTLTMNRTTTGIGTIGDVVEIEDIKTAIFSVRAHAQASGAEATPFSAAV